MAQANPVEITFPDQTVKKYPSFAEASVAMGHNPDYISTKLMEGKYRNYDGLEWRPFAKIKSNHDRKPLKAKYPVEVTAPDGTVRRYSSQLEASIAIGKNSNYIANQINQKKYLNRDGYSWKILKHSTYVTNQFVKVTFPDHTTKTYRNKAQASLAMGHSRNYIDQAGQRGKTSNQQGYSWQFMKQNPGPDTDAKLAAKKSGSKYQLLTRKEILLHATKMYEQLLTAGLASTTAQEALSTQLHIPLPVLAFYFKEVDQNG